MQQCMHFHIEGISSKVKVYHVPHLINLTQSVADSEGGEGDFRPLFKEREKERSTVPEYYLVSVNEIH